MQTRNETQRLLGQLLAQHENMEKSLDRIENKIDRNDTRLGALENFKSKGIGIIVGISTVGSVGTAMAARFLGG